MNGLPEKSMCESAPSVNLPIGTFREIPLTQGKVAIVDEADYERLNKWKWCAHLRRGHWYAKREGPRTDGHRTTIHMHCEVLNPPPGIRPDHINGDGLDNRRGNLRLCSQHQNCYNRQKSKSIATSAFKGVYWEKARGKWKSQIRFNRIAIYLGYFTSEIQAALAYDEAAEKYFGEFAKTNFIDV